MQERAATAPRTGRRRQHPGWLTASRVAVWSATGFALLVVVGSVFAADLSGVWDDPAVPVAFGVLATTCAVVAGCAAVRATTMAPVWTALAAVMLLFTSANLAYAADPPSGLEPSWADGLYGVGYLALVGMPFLLLRRLRLRPHPTVWVDGLTTGLGALALALAVVLSTVHDADAATLLALGYVAADLLLLALLASLGSVVGSFRSVLLPALAVGLQLVADLGQYLAGGNGAPTDLLYVTGPVLLAWAAHRCPPEWTIREQSWRLRLEVRRIVLPLGGSTAALLVLTWSALAPLGAVPVLLAVAALVSMAVRTVLTLRATENFYELRAQALTDPLTGLGNRRTLDAALAGLPDDVPTALLLLDLDSFHDVNDGLGHAAGDEVLRLQAARLTGDEEPPGRVAVRLEGDTFALVLPGTGPAGARAVADEMAARLRLPMHVGGTRVRLTASVGVAVAPAGQPSAPATLLRRADDALTQAKRRAEAVVVHVTDQQPEVEVSRLQLAGELDTAIAEGQLVLWFQPQLHVAPACPVARGGRVTTVAGCEALVRWAHPTRGMLGPDHILGAAEHGRLLPALGDAVLGMAVAAAATWWHHTPVPVSVNLSATDLGDRRLPDRVFQLLLAHRLPPWALTVEVVEDTLMLDPLRVADVLGRLREMGVGIAIDDYGTGYSSLSYLHQLPVDELKLDRSLTQDLATSPTAAAITRHSIALAHDLGLRVVGEGIEDPEGLDALVELGCDTVQGYLTGRPMPLADWTTWLAEQTPPPARVEPATVGS
ncbi:diguanylate cyclase/phosphodiesterase [Klenkia soli]|uniref:Diguanylate cyclase/phosphodiesterase n=1 Tax=Klenkia soli TaxID=1052260 RepID=A0A1H0EQI3_9ACTN|nr:bifunctional diguanylate cyclase/phosphodiesterase [Klenkia soli]SDN84605.1 diguanylate cyclase/phosphodiesterase [Klenkia soli]